MIFFMSVFIIILIISLILVIMAYRKCTKLGLQPPIPVFQKEQFQFVGFLGKQSKIDKYHSLKKYYFSLIIFQVIAVAIFVAMLINA